MNATGPPRSRFEPIALGGIVVFQLLLGACIRESGFVAISDDDYARVVIAQQFAESPAWDPSGTSWLPFPFLHLGLGMKLLSSSLKAARAWALLSACGATLLLYASSRRWGIGQAYSLAGAVVCALLPNSAFLAVATVPEYLTAALIVFGVTSLAAARGKAEFLGGLCLFLACASRYEAWPAAFAASVVFFFKFSGARSPFSLGAAILSLLFPVVWLIHGIKNHNSALFFVKRVADYKDALGESSGRVDAALVYLKALFLAEPEICGALSLLAVLALLKGKSKLPRSTWYLPWIPLAVMLAALVLSALRSGAPTHHVERALLSIWLLATLSTARILDKVSLAPVQAHLTLFVGLLVGFGLRLGGAFERQPFADRAAEEQLGTRLSELASPGEKIGLALSDYGYFAVMAAAQHPGRFSIFETHDPRELKKSDASALVRYERSGGCLYVTATEAHLANGHAEVERVERWSVRKRQGCAPLPRKNSSQTR